MTDELALLDMSVIDELRASVGGDEEFIAELVRAYLDEAPGNLAAMEAAAQGGDAIGIVRPAHTLKSSSAAVGAARLSAICREIEVAGRQGEAGGLPEGVGRARTVWDLTVAAMSAAGLA